MDAIDALAQSFEHTGKIVAGVGPEQLGAPTPCTEWDVRALLAHTIGVMTNIGRGVRGEEMSDPNSTPLDADLDTQFQSAAAATLASWRAADLGAETNIGAGPMPAAVALNINLLDTAVHAWDLARATGQAEAMSDELAETVLAAAQATVTDETRAFAGIGAPVDVGPAATPTERLVAFLGRQP